MGFGWYRRRERELVDKEALNPRILGQAENAHRALLEHFLAGTGLGYREWVALTLVAVSSHLAENDLFGRLISALKIDREAAGDVITHMRTNRLFGGGAHEIQLSETGLTLYQRVRADVDRTVTDLYRGIPGDDLEVAGRVLTEITRRANEKLEQLKR
jgi:hypothetical protein